MYQLDSIRARHDRYTSMIESDSVSVICHINSQLYLSLHLHVYIVQTKSRHGDTPKIPSAPQYYPVYSNFRHRR